jgi:hypothetical protein
VGVGLGACDASTGCLRLDGPGGGPFHGIIMNPPTGCRCERGVPFFVVVDDGVVFVFDDDSSVAIYVLTFLPRIAVAMVRCSLGLNDSNLFSPLVSGRGVASPT